MSQMTKSQKRIVVVLLIVLGYAVFDIVKNWETYKGFYTGTSKKQSTKKSSVVSKKQPTFDTKKENYTSDWGKDPFYVKSQKKQVRRTNYRRTVNLYLKAISFAGGNSVAMINNRILKKGDSIAGYQVVKIEPERVILRKGSRTRVLSLK